jgi:hypothetical protein
MHRLGDRARRQPRAIRSVRRAVRRPGIKVGNSLIWLVRPHSGVRIKGPWRHSGVHGARWWRWLRLDTEERVPDGHNIALQTKTYLQSDEKPMT